jgi:hypothetical protein
MHGPTCILWANLTPFSIQAVASIGQIADARLLVESDAVGAAGLAEKLAEALALVAEARGWSPDRAARVTHHYRHHVRLLC